ncbi:MAG: flagellar basal body rod protein FlgB [Pseudomonadota bacterium]|nr:flagellar basal body rod protein FlgB [Pseudomonadales bacterium]MDY6920611.1 flagellar basal body rod protein FlgB [Pseudomonadota bacterium]
MAISIDKHMALYQNALELRSQRASVLANNIANADTPGYKARDLDFQQMLRARMGETSELTPAATTHQRHFSTLPQGEALSGLKYRNPSQPAIDGNTVDGQTEKTAYARNSMEFQAAFRFLNGKVKSLLSAIRGE